MGFELSGFEERDDAPLRMFGSSSRESGLLTEELQPSASSMSAVILTKAMKRWEVF